MDDNNMKIKKISTGLFIIFLGLLSGCSGSGGIGTEDYRPLTEYSTGPSGEEPGGSINYPEGYVPPVVTITSPSSGKVIGFDQQSLVVSGAVRNGNQKIISLLINGGDAHIYSDNSFSIEIPLPEDSSPFFAIEASAIDANGYAGRDRITVLRGTSVASGTKSSNAVGVILGNSTLALPKEFTAVIADLLNEAVGKKDFDMDSYIRVEVTEPFKAVVDLKLTGINIKTGFDVAINQLYANEPGDADTARLFAGMNLKGIEISADIKFISLGDIKFPDGLADTKVILELNAIAADLSLKMGVKDIKGLGVKISSLDLDLKELEADIPSMIILTKFLDGLGLSPDTYYMKLPVKGWLAGVVSNALNTLVNNKGLGLIVSNIPPITVDESILPEKGKNELIDSILGIRNLSIEAELEKFTGTSNSIGFMAGLGGKSETDNDKDNGVISLPPVITLSEALGKVQNDDMALAISADSINDMLAALNEAGFGLSLDVGKLLPDLGLPADMKADVVFGGPPFLDFSDGKIELYVPNLKTGLYMNASQQLEVAIDLVAEVETEIIMQGGHPYLNLNLKLNDFNIYYLADRLGLEKAVDIERAVKNLMPQILELMKPWLEKTPLVIDDAKAKELLIELNKDNNKLIASICNDLPGFEISLMGLKADGGYLAIGVNVK